MPPQDTLSIAFDMTLLERNSGGSGVAARGLLNALRERDDVRVEVISAAHSGALGTLSWMLSGARRRLRRSRPDAVHCPAFVAPFNSPVPLVLTVHDTSLGRMPEGHPAEWRLFYHQLLPRLARRATAVITPTETTKREIVAEMGVASERVHVTPWGVDGRFFEAPRASDGRGPKLVFAGPPLGRKNLDLVLRGLAAAPAGSALAEARLAITGSQAADHPRYAAMVAEYGLADRVSWLGRLPAEDVPRLYGSADALLYPSFLEGFGLPPLEAMATGTPVVAARASCLPEVLGEAALLVDPADVEGFVAAVNSVLTDAALRQRLRQAGLRRAHAFTWERCADLTVAVYRQVAGA